MFALLRTSGGTYDTNMRADLVEEAKMIVTDPPLLINMVSKRVAQLNRGRRPLLEDTIGLSTADIALKEIIKGLVIIEGTKPPKKKKKAAKKVAKTD